MFVNLILRQIGRSLDIPFGVMVGDSSRYNYSSARLDYQGYDARISYDRAQLVIIVLEWIWEEWIKELSLMRPDVERALKQGDVYNVWGFTSRPSSDPTKEANADDVRLKNGSTNLAESYAARGLDWEDEIEQYKKEYDKLKGLGLDHLIQSKPAPVSVSHPGNEDESDTEETQETEEKTVE
jgi:capsid protein